MRVASSRSVRSEDSLNYGDRRVRQHDIRETDPHRCGRFGGVREFLMRTRYLVYRASVAVCFCPLRHSHRFASRLFSRALLATLHRARIAPLAAPITVKLEFPLRRRPASRCDTSGSSRRTGAKRFSARVPSSRMAIATGVTSSLLSRLAVV